MARDSAEGRKIVASNRRARHEYELLERMEAGIALTGAEVKSIRDGRVSIAEAFARVFSAPPAAGVRACLFSICSPDRIGTPDLTNIASLFANKI